MATVGAADSWQRTTVPHDRPSPRGGFPRLDPEASGAFEVQKLRHGPPPVPPLRPRPTPLAERHMEASEGGRYVGDSQEFRRPSRRDEPAWDDDRDSPAADRAARRTGLPSGAPARRQPSAPQDDTGLRGFLAVAAVLLVTLVVATADSFLGTGLGLITLIGLVLATAVAAFLVRRRDLISLLVAPPLVYVAVTAITATVGSSGHPSLAAVASQLIRGFPAMGIATGAGLLIALFRLATRR